MAEKVADVLCCWGYMGLYGAIWGYMGLYGTIWGNMGGVFKTVVMQIPRHHPSFGVVEWAGQDDWADDTVTTPLCLAMDSPPPST